MLFSQQDSFKIEKLIIDYSASLETLNNEICTNTPILLKGYGFFGISYKQQFSQYSGLFVLNINDSFYGIMCDTNINKIPTEQEQLFFSQIIKLSPEILNSAIMEIQGSHNYFKKYETELPIETKYYDYDDEYKLLLNKEGQNNISLYCSIQIKKKDNAVIFKTFPAADTVAKELHLKEIIEKRFSKLTKQ